MEVTKPVVAMVAATCITVGAAGGYLMTRHAGPSGADPAASVVGPGPGASGLDSPEAVEQSETIVGETTPAPAVSAPPQTATPARPAPSRPAAAPADRPQPAPAPVAPSSPALTEVTPIAPAPIEPARPALETETVKAAEPPVPEYQDLVLAPDSVIGLRVQTLVSSETARLEDPVAATIVRDVKVGDHVAIPAGAEVRGEVTLVERGGKMKDRARLGIRFTSVVLADGSRVPIATETIYREGDAPGRESTTKIGGGAIGGAIIGGILGGAKGAAIGSAIGGGAGSAAVMAGGRNPATLSPGSTVTIRLQQPATVTVQR